MEPVTIAVMGATGSGKSTFINTISNSSLQTSAGLRSCTDSVHESPPFQLDGRNVVLIDTPGFDDTSKSDTEILELIAQFLVTSYQDGRKLSGLIFIHRISDVRMGGVSTKNFRMFRKLCGESTLKNVIIVTNMWGNVEQEIGEAREAELATQDEFFKPVLDKGAKMMRHLNTVDSAQVIVRQVFPYQAEALQIQKEVVDEKKDLSQTAAADEIDRELKEIAEKQRLERERIQAEAEATLRRQQEEAQRQIELQAQRAREETARIYAERRRLEEDMRRERREHAREMREQQEKKRLEEERVRREYEAHLEAIRLREQEQAWQRQQERARLQRQILEEQRRRDEDSGGCVVQ